MIFFTTISSDDADILQLVSRWATKDDLSHAESYRNKQRAQDFLTARAAMRALLSQTTYRADWLIRPDDNGKPYTLTASGHRGPHISLAHTGGMIACVVSESGPVGIDIEHWRPRDFTALAQYAYGPQENEDVAREGADAFYRIWVLKEAVAKMSGQGLWASLNQRDEAAGTTGHTYWTQGDWQLFYSQPHPGYSLAIAAQNQIIWTEQTVIWKNIVKP